MNAPLGMAWNVRNESEKGSLPGGDHVVVHLLQLLLGGVKGVGWWVELVGLEALVGEADLEGLLLGLCNQCQHLFLEVPEAQIQSE